MPLSVSVITQWQLFPLKSQYICPWFDVKIGKFISYNLKD